MDKNGLNIDRISALIPVYDENGGNLTRIIYSCGSDCIYPKTLKTVIHSLSRQFSLDLAHVRKRYGSMICQRNIVPLPLSFAATLIPFKFRRPLFIRDGSIGYVKLEDIEDITKDSEERGVLLMRNGSKLGCQDSYKSCQRHLNNAKLIKNMRERDLGLFRISEQGPNMTSLAHSPATKEDIALLIREILIIRDKLGR